MIPEFSNLEDAEVELMLKAPILVCILIAGADGNIDKKEIREAIAIARKNIKDSGILTAYFKELSEDFEDKLKVTIQSYPYESNQRSPLIVAELSSLNSLWSKISKPFAVAYYQALIEIAGKVASSSGGLLGIKSVGNEEARYMELPMINKPA
jgi:hypothetical protein